MTPKALGDVSGTGLHRYWTKALIFRLDPLPQYRKVSPNAIVGKTLMAQWVAQGNAMAMTNLIQAGFDPLSKRLKLACGLTQFPPEILELADTLEILDLSNNQLSALPDEFSQLQRLKIVFLSNNQFESLPEVLSQCPHLSMIGFKSNQIQHVSDQALPPNVRWLILTDNQLERLPTTLGNQHRLQKLMLAGNRLQFLPEELAACHNLELLRISANQLQELPKWLLSLPKLSWLAYAGNPFCAHTTSITPALPDIDWADLSLQEALGQGASGIISKSIWQTAPDQSQTVAVKIFKGDITSDGLPSDEMQACIAAGSHKHLVSPLGKIVHHPDGKAGLVFSFVPADYQVLGGPPSLATCTRDVYRPGTVFTGSFALRVAQNIAAAAAHLHRQGILHGDLYAHNILVSRAGESLLGDFGAASFYDPGDAALAPQLERLEVRAFGCLLEDLLQHCDLQDSSTQAALEPLRNLQQTCMASPEQRPLFHELCSALASIATDAATPFSAQEFSSAS